MIGSGIFIKLSLIWNVALRVWRRSRRCLRGIEVMTQLKNFRHIFFSIFLDMKSYLHNHILLECGNLKVKKIKSKKKYMCCSFNSDLCMLICFWKICFLICIFLGICFLEISVGAPQHVSRSRRPNHSATKNTCRLVTTSRKTQNDYSRRQHRRSGVSSVHSS